MKPWEPVWAGNGTSLRLEGGESMEITLTSAEMLVLRKTLEKAMHDMLMEIANTDNRKMRDGLKEREGILTTILAKLPAEERTAA
jgi:hypothetical protein